jgi:hypothetical protein
VYSKLEAQMVRNAELEARVAIQGNQMEKLTEEHDMHLQLIPDLARSPHSRTSPPQVSVSSLGEVAME